MVPPVRRPMPPRARLRQLLKPDRRKLLLFAMLAVLAVGGVVQGWGFSDGAGPASPLYDVLRPVPLWPVAVLLLTPLLVLSAPLLAFGLDVSALDSWFSVAALGGYLYGLACLGVTALAEARAPARRADPGVEGQRSRE